MQTHMGVGGGVEIKSWSETLNGRPERASEKSDAKRTKNRARPPV